jgi:hypothetical protein
MFGRPSARLAHSLNEIDFAPEWLRLARAIRELDAEESGSGPTPRLNCHSDRHSLHGGVPTRVRARD